MFENFEAYDVVETRKTAFAEGRTEGKAETLYSLVIDGLISAEIGAQRSGVDEATFVKGLTEYTRSLTE